MQHQGVQHAGGPAEKVQRPGLALTEITPVINLLHTRLFVQSWNENMWLNLKNLLINVLIVLIWFVLFFLLLQIAFSAPH